MLPLMVQIVFIYSAACWFCLTHSAFSKFIWISWIIKIASLVACWSAFLLRSSKHVSAFSLVLVASCSFWAMFDYGCTVLACQIEAKCWSAVVYSVVGLVCILLNPGWWRLPLMAKSYLQCSWVFLGVVFGGGRKLSSYGVDVWTIILCVAKWSNKKL